MILRHRLRKALNARPGGSGRGGQPGGRATDAILVMLAVLLVSVCLIKILHG
jgi:hypothetical protein